MSLKIEKGYHYFGIWFGDFSPAPITEKMLKTFDKERAEEIRKSGQKETPMADFMAYAYRKDSEPNKWTLAGRVRFHKDDKAFDSEDTKKWFGLELHGGEIACSLKIDDTLETLKTPFPNQNVKFYLIDGDSDKFQKMIMDGEFDFMHTKKIDTSTPEGRAEAERIGIPLDDKTNKPKE